MVKENVTTITLTGEEVPVKFSAGYPFYWVNNLGDSEVYALSSPNITADADGVCAVPSGGSVRLGAGSPAETIYLLGTGRVQIYASGNAHCPFKLAPKGGEGGGGSYTLPVATATRLGGVKSGGDISVSASGGVTVNSVNGKTVGKDVPENAIFTDTVYTLPTATADTLGGVKIDGKTIKSDENGVISAVGSGSGGGEENIIESIKVNGVEQAVGADKSVNITVPSQPTKVSELENDSGYLTDIPTEYITETELNGKGYLTAVPGSYATKTYVGEQIANAGHLTRSIVTVIPGDEDASENVIYMLKVDGAAGDDKYKEYMKIDGAVQLVGDTSVDLSDYAKTSDLSSHIGDTVKHITSTERTNWNAAKTHADSAHAPSNAQSNVIETVKVNGTALTPSSKSVDITVPSVGNGTITITQNGTTKGTFTTNQSGNTTIELTDNNTTYGVATSSALGLVKSGTDITVDSNGNVSVNDASHKHEISNVNGLQSALDGKASSSHTHSSYVNQNAFSNITVGSTTVSADTATDTLTLVAGSNVTITPDATNDKITIAATDTKYTLPTASTTTLGGVKVDGTTITTDENGVISAVDGGSGGGLFSGTLLYEATSMDSNLPTGTLNDDVRNYDYLYINAIGFSRTGTSSSSDKHIMSSALLPSACVVNKEILIADGAYASGNRYSSFTIASDGKTIFQLGNTRYLSIRGINI